MSDELSIGVQGDPVRTSDWSALARRVEELGFDRLFVADHPGTGAAPFVALAAAAAVTERLELGSYVVNAGAWEPLALASQVATLDLVSAGRAVLGIGAGHTPAEWRMRGVPYPGASERVERMIELLDATRRLLHGEEVTLAGGHLTLQGARLAQPRPVRQPVPLTVGGNGRRVLRVAAERADVVGLAGLGRTLADGRTHEVRWAPEQISASIEHVHATAEEAGRTPQLEALVQHVEITTDAEAAAAALTQRIPGLTVEQVLAAPFVWVGTADRIAEQLRGYRDRWGITRYVVRADVLDAAHAVHAALASSAP
ncbi:MAG: TIGR03621 family F420-dependent LLM class oxidoreductase [Nitriliruptoraceae bacterium]|nr:TIGR03621 family F420-dependent LLM class oxidoreductase [Nitriliruptoraceae bacterium]